MNPLEIFGIGVFVGAVLGVFVTCLWVLIMDSKGPDSLSVPVGPVRKQGSCVRAFVFGRRFRPESAKAYGRFFGEDE